MKNLIYKFIVIIFAVTILFSQNVIFASMADYTDEQADENLEQEQVEFKQEQVERINKSSNNYLKALSVKGYEISPNFDKQIINYEIAQEITDDNLEIKAEADDEKASVLGSGKVILNSGENNIKIDVTAENGTVRTYFIKVKKSVKKDVKLNSLKVSTDNESDIEITPEFNSNVFEYNCKMQNYVEKLNIEATCDLKDAKIEIKGNENLKEGLNEILVTVSTENDEKVVYKINAYKEKTMQNQNEIGKKEINYTTYLPIIIVIIIIAIIIFVKNRKKGKHDK